MDEPITEPMLAWRFIRRYFVRIVIGAVLVAAVYGALLVWVPYQREQRIVREIEALGGKVDWSYFGPDWIPQSMRRRATLFSRVEYLTLHSTKITDAELEHLKGLTNVKWLDLDGTQVTAEGRSMLRKALPNCKVEPDP